MPTIQTVVDTAFRRDLTVLNDHGEISFMHLKAFLMVYDATRLYLANIGVRSVSRDPSKLLEQRAELMREMALVKADIQLLGDAERDDYEDSGYFNRERGGDVHLLQIDDDSSFLSDDPHPSTPIAAYPDPREPSDEQRLRRQARKRSKQRPEDGLGVEVRDARVFASGCRHSDGVDGHFASETILMRRWAAMRRYKEPLEGELHLDVDTLEDLFETIGLELSDHDAVSCLKDTPKNQANMYLCEDILKWFYHYRHECNIHYPQWFTQLAPIMSAYTSMKDTMLAWLEVLDKQARILEGQGCHQDYNRIVNRFGAPLHVSQLNSDKTTKYSTLNFSFTCNEREDNRMATAASTARTTSTTPTSAKRTPPGELKRAQSSVRSRLTPGSLMKAVSLRAAEEVEQRQKGKYPCYVHVKLSTAFDGNPNVRLLSDESNHLMMPLRDVTAADILRHFNTLKFKNSQKPTTESDGRYRSVIWGVLNVSPGCRSLGLEVLRLTSLNLFRSIPQEMRGDIYTAVEGGVFSAHMDDVGDSGVSPQVILVALLHERDLWKEFEAKLPMNLLVSRSLRSLDLNVLLRENLMNLFTESKQYVDYISKLYGPQEEELGEEMMNPLRFAKSCRQSKRDIEERLENIENTSIEQIKEALESRGYATSGSKPELCERYKAVLRREMELIGFGEMSLFGKTVCSHIFRRFDEDGDGALSLREMNSLLSALNKHSIYDAQEYRALNDKNGFLTDAAGNLTLKGFLAYFQVFGHLSECVEILGIGSLDDLLSGRVYGTMEVQDDCVSSLLSICESQSYAQRLLKVFVLLTSNIKDLQCQFRYEKLSDIFHGLGGAEMESTLSSPGWLARSIYFLEECLADGDNGFICSLRKSASDTFNDYDSFLMKFAELTKSAPILPDIMGILPPLIEPKVSSYSILFTIVHIVLSGEL